MFRPRTDDLYAENLKKYGPEDPRTILEPAHLAETRRKHAIDMLLEYPRILDLGCGPGVFAQALLDAHPGLVQYTGVEAVHDFVQCARKRLRDHLSRVQIVRAELEIYKYPLGCDVVSCLGVMSDLEPTRLHDFINHLTHVAYSHVGLVISFHNIATYYGKLATAFDPGDVLKCVAAFGWQIYDVKYLPNDSLVLLKAIR